LYAKWWVVRSLCFDDVASGIDREGRAEYSRTDELPVESHDEIGNGRR
jgi:hypothetical protein